MGFCKHRLYILTNILSNLLVIRESILFGIPFNLVALSFDGQNIANLTSSVVMRGHSLLVFMLLTSTVARVSRIYSTVHRYVLPIYNRPRRENVIRNLFFVSCSHNNWGLSAHPPRNNSVWHTLRIVIDWCTKRSPTYLLRFVNWSS